jgi:hypothetical protein
MSAGQELPRGTRFLHIGPHKTGTTALQAAFHLARDRAEEQGVHYASYGRQPVTAVRAGIGKAGARSANGKPPNIRHWRWLVREIERSRADRILLSSENFADAEPEAIARVVADLDPARVHVVVTLRPLARIIPSQWQQYVQNRLTSTFDHWVDAILNQPRGTVTPTFWHRHRHDELVDRWAQVVGHENLTVVALDDADREMLFRAFEQLLGLTPGTLVADPNLTNRSMSLAEIEVIRAFNVAFQEAGLPAALYERILHTGAASLQTRRAPDPREGRVALPAWSLAPVAEISRAMVESIAASGVRIVGDLDSLRWVPAEAADQLEMHVSPDVAASAMMGIVLASGLAHGVGGGSDLPVREPPELFRVSTIQLGIALLRRVRAAAQRRISRLFRRR